MADSSFLMVLVGGLFDVVEALGSDSSVSIPSSSVLEGFSSSVIPDCPIRCLLFLAAFQAAQCSFNHAD